MKLRRENRYVIPLLLVLLLILLDTKSTRAQEVEDEREFDYIEGSEKGPRHWGELKEEWAACKNGDMQSPVDLSCARVKIIPSFHQLETNYKSSNATIINRGHDIAVYWKDNDAGSIRVNGTEFFLQQCHWHSPSEHSINGRKYDLEMHMLHVSSDNKIFVVGAFYKIGLRSDRFLYKLEKDIEHMVDEEEERVIGETNPPQLQTRGKMYYRYVGSLTTPPCTEGVIWNIDRKVLNSISPRRDSKDGWIWNNNLEIAYSVKVVYELFSQHQDTSEADVFTNLWSKLIPSKMNAFGWRLLLNRIQTEDNLSKRGFSYKGEM